MNPQRHRVLLALAGVPLALALAGCGGNDASSKSSADSGGVAASRPASDDAVTADAATGGGAPADREAAKAAVDTVVERAVIATGQLRVSTRDLAGARQDAVNLATGMHGFVADEQSQSDTHGGLDRVDLTLRVPAASFEKALDGLAALGTVRDRKQSVEDVTTQVIDNASRVRTQKASVERVQQLLARANSIAEIMSIESQLASRQADLDSLEQQQKWLADQTSYSTVQLTLVHLPKAQKHEEHHRSTGFLAGLEGGWHALGGTAVAVGTVVGAVLPFAVLLALVGVPVWLVQRRRRTVIPAPPAEV